MKAVIILLCIGVGASVAPRAAEACDCSAPSQPCAALRFTDTVFTGNVTGFDRDADGAFYTIEVGEVFLGKPGAIAKVRTGGSVCDASFQIGKPYLVYGDSSPAGALRVSMCSRTRVLDKLANDDLRFLRSLATRTTGTVEGTVVLQSTLHAGAVVRAHGTPHTATADASGHYRLELPPGTFTLEVDEPGTIPAPANLVIRNVGACQQANFNLQWNGRIRGRVVDSLGQPVANVQVQARPAVGDQHDQDDGSYVYGALTRTDAHGDYELSGLAEGAYVVVVGHRFDPDEGRPTTYAPGVADRSHATPVTLARAAVVDGVDLKLPPPYRMRQITVQVVEGRAPVAACEVHLRNERAKREQQRMTDGQGNVVLREQDGAEVQLDACNGYAGKRACSEIATVKLTRDARVKLELKDDLPMPRLP